MTKLICIIMAGGKASRLGFVEKPLIKICGKPIIERIANVASNICNDVYVAISPHTPKTKLWCLENNIKIIETKGKDYVHDLQGILKKFKKPLLILPCDTPFITINVLLEFIEKAKHTESSVVTLIVDKHCFPETLRRENTEPIGISLFKSNGVKWSNVVMCRFPELLDIDTSIDLRYAEEICK